MLIGVVALGSARAARFAIASERLAEFEAAPYAPSPEAAPFVTLGYREVAVDLLWVRFRGYFGGQDSTSRGIGNLVDAIIALDPKFQRVYRYGAHALQLAVHGVDQASHHHAIRVLERGMREFPDDWRMFELAAQIYTQDLRTTDPAQRRAWDERGTLLMEAAIRKPGAPRGFATWAATMRTRLGQHERAVKDLHELILITSDVKARARLIAKLAELEQEDAAAIASEIHAERQQFEVRWLRERPALPPTWYILLGPRPERGFDMGDLATGGRDLLGSDAVEPLEPLE